MKYKTEIDINLPVNKVVELFDNVDNLYKWQPELVSFEHLSGEAGEPGAKSKLKYKMGKREVEMIETITERNLPEVFAGTYEAKGVFNHVANQFVSLSENKTKWIADSEFKFSGIMYCMAPFMTGAFKKQTWKYFEQFKEFVESEV